MLWRVVPLLPSAGLSEFPLVQFGFPSLTGSRISRLPTLHYVVRQALTFHAMNVWHKLRWLFYCKLHYLALGFPFGFHPCRTTLARKLLPTSYIPLRCHLLRLPSVLHYFQATAVSSWTFLTLPGPRTMLLISLVDGEITNLFRKNGRLMDDAVCICATSGLLILRCILSRLTPLFHFRFRDLPCLVLLCSSSHFCLGGFLRFVTASFPNWGMR